MELNRGRNRKLLRSFASRRHGAKRPIIKTVEPTFYSASGGRHRFATSRRDGLRAQLRISVPVISFYRDRVSVIKTITVNWERARLRCNSDGSISFVIRVAVITLREKESPRAIPYRVIASRRAGDTSIIGLNHVVTRFERDFEDLSTVYCEIYTINRKICFLFLFFSFILPLYLSYICCCSFFWILNYSLTKY